MHFEVITLFPEMIENYCQQGVIGRAFQKKKISLNTINPRQFTENIHHSVDDRPFGGGDGMVMSLSPLDQSLKLAKQSCPKGKMVYLSPQGQVWNDQMSREWAEKEESLILLSGRYAGVDQRLIHKWSLEEISIGDYVLSGGELPAMVLIDSISRFLPGVLGNDCSAVEDSFGGNLLEAPQFTRPRDFEGMKVPEFLLSGDHAKIQEMRKAVSILLTVKKRPDLSVPEKEVFWAEEVSRSLSLEERSLLGL